MLQRCGGASTVELHVLLHPGSPGCPIRTGPSTCTARSPALHFSSVVRHANRKCAGVVWSPKYPTSVPPTMTATMMMPLLRGRHCGTAAPRVGTSGAAAGNLDWGVVWDGHVCPGRARKIVVVVVWDEPTMY